MIGGMLRKIFGTPNDRIIASLQGSVDAINAAEPALEQLSDDELGVMSLRDHLLELRSLMTIAAC